jgi:hypothetical protein
MMAMHKPHRILLAMIFVVVILTAQIDAIAQAPTPWSQIPAAPMQGDLKLFWHVAGGDNAYNHAEAVKHGFQLVDGINTYADYPGKQRENIYHALKTNSNNPWRKPAFFEKTVRKNIATLGQGAIVVHDIEFEFERSPESAWGNPQVQADAGRPTWAEFAAAYFQQWATWFSLPCQWTKQALPNTPVGLYGPQVFNRDYWGFLNKSPEQFNQAHQADLQLWQHIDPAVDFYTASVYIPYNTPDSLYYMAANIEENVVRSRQFGNRPVYAYLWLRFHPGNQSLNQAEIAPYMAEASAVIPFFSGAKGLVLWGWEPKGRGQYYQTLPVFMNRLSQVANLSGKLSRATLVIDEPAAQLWREKRPLVRKLKLSTSEWLVMAVNPWQQEGDRSTVPVQCGDRWVQVSLSGQHTAVYHVQGNQVEPV